MEESDLGRNPQIIAPYTVSVGKGFGSKGKQHHKHTASETQSHNKWSHQMQRKIMKYLQSSSDKE